MIKVYNKSSENMIEVENESVQLVVTSPPYNCGMDYGCYDDSQEFNDYLGMLSKVWQECERVLVPGGRIAVNVSHGNGRRPYMPLGSYITLQIEQFFQLRGTIIWQKQSVSNKTSWGSWRLPNDPSLRDVCEIIVVANKQGNYNVPDTSLILENGKKYSPWLDKETFMSLTLDLWCVPPVTGRSAHPAPFPIEIPLRLAKLYAYPGATVLDPFAGSGSTGLACKQLGLSCHLYEINPGYCELIKNKLSQEVMF